jgi:hypothetical protein
MCSVLGCGLDPTALSMPNPQGGEWECLLEDDGIIQPDELPLFAGAQAPYWVHGGLANLDIEPRHDAEGNLSWDLSRPSVQSDQRVILGPLSRSAAAPAKDPLPGSLSFPLNANADLWSQVEATPQGLKVWGFHSSPMGDESEGVTEIALDQGLTFMPFPLKVGDEVFTHARDGDAIALGWSTAIEESWRARVKGRGALILPDWRFDDAMHLEITATRRTAYGSRTDRTDVFVQACVGEVARYSQATSELWRRTY